MGDSSDVDSEYEVQACERLDWANPPILEVVVQKVDSLQKCCSYPIDFSHLPEPWQLDDEKTHLILLETLQAIH